VQPDVQTDDTPPVPATTEPVPVTTESAPTPTTTELPPHALVEEDLLVEDVSIDGMCGVY
jgi:mycofactocin precursor